MDKSKAAQDYANGMALYSAIISLQEAQRWIESGYIDHAKTQVDFALKELYSISDSEKKPA